MGADSEAVAIELLDSASIEKMRLSNMRPRNKKGCRETSHCKCRGGQKVAVMPVIKGYQNLLDARIPNRGIVESLDWECPPISGLQQIELRTKRPIWDCV